MNRIQLPHTEVSRMTRLRKQRGMTLISLLLVGVLLVFGALVIMKLFPIYNEAFKVSSSLETVASQAGIGSKSTKEIHALMMRSFAVQDVDRLKLADLKRYLKVTKQKGKKGRDMTMKYEIRGPLFGNLDVVLKYDKTLPIGGSK